MLTRLLITRYPITNKTVTTPEIYNGWVNKIIIYSETSQIQTDWAPDYFNFPIKLHLPQ